MTPTIADLARSVLDGSARNDDAKALARWVLDAMAPAASGPCVRCWDREECRCAARRCVACGAKR